MSLPGDAGPQLQVPSVLRLQEAIEELTGTVAAERRAELWAMPHKKMFFMTPQTFKNDLVKGAPGGLRPHAAAPVVSLAIQLILNSLDRAHILYTDSR